MLTEHSADIPEITILHMIVEDMVSNDTARSELDNIATQTDVLSTGSGNSSNTLETSAGDRFGESGALVLDNKVDEDIASGRVGIEMVQIDVPITTMGSLMLS